jgi:hypothetical protein
MLDSNLQAFGCTWPKDVIERRDRAKGPLYSRNKYMLMLVMKHLDEKEEKTGSPQQKGSAHQLQSAAPISGAKSDKRSSSYHVSRRVFQLYLQSSPTFRFSKFCSIFSR